MPSNILIKRSSTASAIPTAQQLLTGELAINLADKKLYTNNNGSIIELGTLPSSLSVSGNTALTTLDVTGATTLTAGNVSGDFTVVGTLTVPTPASGTDAASKAYVDASVSSVIDSSPALLNTLNELAAAINDDADFATTITNSIATKVSKAGDTLTGDLVMGGNKITSTATPVTDDTLTRKGYVDSIFSTLTAAETSATASETSAVNSANSASSASASAATATTKASEASTSATNAATSASSASTSASAASTSASAASTSASAAATSEANAESAWDSFEQRYLGSLATAPTPDSDIGSFIIEGSLYWNSVSDDLFIYTGSSWVLAVDGATSAAAALSEAAALVSENNAAASEAAALAAENNAAASAVAALAAENNAAVSASTATTKTSLATSEANRATTQANNAAASASTATTKAALATSEANRATTEANNAAAVVTGGTATLAATAGKIPLADADGVIEPDWLPAEVTGRNTFAEDQARGNSKYAASGFVHMGKSRHNSGIYGEEINEGLWAYTANSNVLLLGGDASNVVITGESKTGQSIINIAGIETELAKLNTTRIDSCTIKFPEAPNGTVTYDSATGVITDYTTDVDPKYGDVATDVNEAVARAFEGLVRNGDFRNGVDEWSVPTSCTTTVNADGTVRLQSTTSTSGLSQAHATGGTGTFYIDIVSETTASAHLQYHDGTGWKNVSLDVGLNSIPATIGTVQFYIRGSANTYDFTIRSYVFIPDNEEVVTERVDMYGLEAYLEEVTVTNPYVYPNGLIQSQATTMNGISTSASNRPATYYAVFDGDTGSVGKGVDFINASNANKVKMFSDPKNNLYWIEGKLYQWRVRQRTIAGAGNGDWRESRIDSTAAIDNWAGIMGWSASDSATNVKGVPVYSQGYSDVVVAGANTYLCNNSYTHTYNTRQRNLGIFRPRYDAYAYDNQCYFLVLGTVPRLNQGAFHPSFNPMGSASQGRVSNNGSGSVNWYHKPAQDGREGFSTKDYFDENTAKCVGTLSGAIGDGSASRPDGRFYDAIYASGQGGVIDYRLSAWDKSSPEEASKVDALVKNGSYRGVEKLVRTYMLDIGDDTIYHYGSFGSALKLDVTSCPNLHAALAGLMGVTGSPNVMQMISGNTYPQHGMQHYLFYTFNAVDYAYIIDFASGSNTHLVAATPLNGYPARPSAHGLETVSNVRFILTVTDKLGDSYISNLKTNISVSGEFTQTDVMGDPAYILANPDLKDGWLGSWGGMAISEDDVLSRKSLGNKVDNVYTSNGSWGTQQLTINEITNAYQVNFGATSVTVNNYTAFAKQTKVANNEPVFNGEAGVGSVWTGADFRPTFGSVFSEGLMGVVVTSGATASRPYILSLISYGFEGEDTGKIENSTGLPVTHSPVLVGGSSNGSNAIKALNYQVESNQQASLNYAYEELTYDVDWGDNGAMAINSGQTTNTDDNGNTVLCGTATLAIPYGWSKNNV